MIVKLPLDDGHLVIGPSVVLHVKVEERYEAGLWFVCLWRGDQDVVELHCFNGDEEAAKQYRDLLIAYARDAEVGS